MEEPVGGVFSERVVVLETQLQESENQMLQLNELVLEVSICDITS